MLVELTGPSASGKTTLARCISKGSNDIILLRNSSDATLAEKLVFKYYISSVITYNIISFITFIKRKYKSNVTIKNRLNQLKKTFKWNKHKFAFDRIKELDMTFMIDQGVFQLGSWFNHEEIEDTNFLTNIIPYSFSIPDILILISIPPEVSVDRAKSRGDLHLCNQKAIKRGFTSFKHMCTHELENESKKLELAKRFNITIIYVQISQSNVISKMQIIRNNVCKSINNNNHIYMESSAELRLIEFIRCYWNSTLY